ncbi:hypothetical protein PHYBLDRAFT_140995 [Phycomyces blakesleeanus NRRL 1555(-)]|uniref:FAR1 domain-containing protein n=1 Tax=Phycomyces blakesleeanus (strain ATCC 8743b / DSM 1359 / FGSC 10004 / NBRC 33097 / NRRL 1555) TaxID=763407 RepID=A0A167Q292_PHYB8|nr:hypothetical protein PHYBLDRAFT_140995 [Phycomyces blakesleeanus NRRL 1555(-)]OAD78937.1 hypothetical protein PHYBLDRAFT_140995 [Phycomyces blakesleeanus NRRL 1555(-)]|eukprot:XP_018296977.1 hypothetical protein PHYBLDRAFT_140995 [Phycomyces blakesleeanus NRRL 1555(-)]
MNPLNKETFVADGIQYYRVKQPLPTPPPNGYKDMAEAVGKMQEYALSNNFALATKDRKPTRVYLKCSKGGRYRSTRKIQECDRKKISPSRLTGCPYLLKLSYKKSIQGYMPLKPTREIEGYHNHPLDEKCLESTLKGRLSKISIDDVKEIAKLIDNNAKTRDIQRAINDDSHAGHKLYVSDINNIKAAFARISAPTQDAGTKLVKVMESKGYRVINNVNQN